MSVRISKGVAMLWGMTILTAAAVATAQPAPEAAKAVATANEKLLAWQTKEAREALEPVKGAAATDVAVAVALAQVMVQEKKYADAVKQLEEAAKLAPTDAAVQVALGDAYLLVKRSGDATVAFQRAVTVASEAAHGGDARARFQLAQAQQRLKQFDKAAAGFSQLVEASGGNDATALFELGVTRTFQNRWQDAFETLTKALEKNAGIAYAYYYRGLAAEKLGRKDVLINDMGRFLYLAPNAPEASRAQAILNAAKR